MLTHGRQILLFCALVAIVALWIRWWASSGFVLEGQICEVAEAPKNCESYDVFSYSAWRLAAAADHWSALVTAIATGFVAWFTWTLWRSSEKMWEATKISADASTKATKTAQAEFVATHRPKIRVRNIVIDPPKSADCVELELFAEGYPVRGQLEIANVGGSRADILDGHCMVYWSSEGLPMRRPYEGAVDNLRAQERSLLSGQSTTARFRSDRTMEPNIARTFTTQVIRGFTLYVMGWVTYADRNQDVRRTCFCREYRRIETNAFATPRFFAVDDPDYEYEE